MASGVGETAEKLLTSVSEALTADLRPVCKEYQTVGTPVILTCCECDDEGTNGELSIHFRRLFDADPSTLNEIQRVRPCKGGVLAANYRLVLARCFPTVDERGELPDQEVLSEIADELHRDAEMMWQGLACAGLDLRIDDLSVDLGPKGGCSIIYVDVTAFVQVPPIPKDSSA